MARKKREGITENFLMYFSSIVAVFLIVSLSFSSFALPTEGSLNNVAMSSSLFLVLALSMFLYMTMRIRGSRIR